MINNNFGMDLGFSSSKAYFRGKTNLIKSIVGDGRVLKLDKFAIGKDSIKKIICMEGNKTYFVGDLALRESNSLFHSLNGDRFDDIQVTVLAKSLLADTMKEIYEPINIITGLPVDQYYKYRSSLRQMIDSISNYEVMINDEMYQSPCMVENVSIVPQPFGALANMILNDSGELVNTNLASSVVAIIDIGFGTTDILVCDSLSIIEKYSFTSDIAINSVYKSAQQLIKEKTGKEEVLFKLDDEVNKGYYKYKGNHYSIENHIDSSMESTANSLLDVILTKWGGFINNIDTIIVAGGGSVRMTNYIKKYLSKGSFEIIKDSSGRYGIVKGYGKWGVFNAR